MDISKYKSLFITESREHLEEMTSNLLALERNPTDKAIMDELFRHAHSIKGMASSMEYDPIEILSHTIEDTMDIFRKDLAELTTEAVDELLAGRDAIDAMVTEVEQSEEPGFDKALSAINRLKDWCEVNLPRQPDKTKIPPKTLTPPTEPTDRDFGGFDGEVVSPAEVEHVGSMTDWPDDHLKTDGGEANDWYIILGFEGETEAPAARAFLALKRIETLGEFKSVPTIDEIKAGEFAGSLKIELKGPIDIDKVREVLDGLTGVKQYQLEPLGAPAAAAKTSPPSSEVAEPATGELPRMVRVDTRALDDFINIVGELLTVKSSLRDLAQTFEDPQLDMRLDKLESLIHELHSQVMDVRMMPLDTITSRLPRIVRDLAHTAAKEVELVVSGEDIDLDRAILERLNDPLLHLLRNCVDHGIEYPEKREKLKKTRTGKITIEARREKDMIVIEISDDGKGMDTEALKETAVAKGIIDAESAETISAEDTLMLICIPGFSTSEEVSFISGRGVGMDVVKSTIESLGGGLRIDSTIGEGTRIILYLPRTVSIINVLLVNVEPETFAVPIGKLLKTVEIHKNVIKESQKGRMVLLDSEPIPLYGMREMLGMTEKPHEGDIFSALVVEHGTHSFAVTVDAFLGQEEAFIRTLGRPLSRIEGLSGVMTRGDGKPVFVLDISNLRTGGAQT